MIAPVQDTFLWYREIGNGPRCLVMHGGLGIDHHAYSPGLDPLGESMRLVYYDHRCHGSSGDAPLDTLTLGRLAEDADELRAHLGEDRIGVLGHSFGGFIAYELAARHPDRIAFLIIVCSSPAFDFGAELSARMDGALTAEMRDVLAMAPPASSHEWQERMKLLLPLYFHHWNDGYAAALTSEVRPNYPAAIAAGADLAGWDRWVELEHLPFPVLLVAGRHDFIPHLSRAERAVRLLPDATLLVMEHSGHYPWLEEPDTFTTAVTDWTRDHASR